jgi:hypothetical protein
MPACIVSVCPPPPAKVLKRIESDLLPPTYIDTGPKLYESAPICVQLVGYRYADEALTHTASLIDAIINGAE